MGTTAQRSSSPPYEVDSDRLSGPLKSVVSSFLTSEVHSLQAISRNPLILIESRSRTVQRMLFAWLHCVPHLQVAETEKKNEGEKMRCAPIILAASAVAQILLFVSSADAAIFRASIGPHCVVGDIQSTPVSVVTPACSPFTQVSVEGMLSAQSSYSGLSAYTEWYQTQIFPTIFATAGTEFAGAGFSDQLLVAGGLGSGFLQMTVVVEGTTSTTGAIAGFPVAYGELSTGGPGYFLNASQQAFLVSGPGSYLFELPFVFGETTELSLGLTAGLTFLLYDLGATYGGISDFTASFSALSVFDSNHSQVAGASVVAVSGHVYDVLDPVSAVPAPSSLALLFGAWCAWLLSRRWCSRQTV